MEAAGFVTTTASAVAVLLAQSADASWTASPTGRWLVVGGLALVAVWLLVAAVRCALRLVGLAVLALVAWLAWRWFT